jgi:hypothetical protein
LYYFVLRCIALYYFKFCYILSLMVNMGPIPWGLQYMYYAIITCGSGAWVSICHTLFICSSGACRAHAMPSLYVVFELVAKMACPHHMQFWSLYGICPVTITCNPGINTGHMSCHCQMQFRSSWYICIAPSYCFVLLFIALCYFRLPCITLYLVAL